MDESSKSIAPRPITLPILPLRDVVVFPNFVIPLFVGRKNSKKALNHLDPDLFLVMLVAQHDAVVENPGPEDIYQIGCVASVKQTVVLGDGSKKVVVEGLWRAEIIQFLEGNEFMVADTQPLQTVPINPMLAESLMDTLLSEFEKYVKNSQKIPADILSSLPGLLRISAGIF